MREPIRYEIKAFNTATASENRMHDDAVAAKFGFTGGLVPGVDVYAYMTRAAVLGFGESFLSKGRMTCRFTLPAYDGETVEVTGREDGDALRIEVAARGKVLASGEAWAGHEDAPVSIDDMAGAQLPAPDQRPPAGPQSLFAGAALGSFVEELAESDMLKGLDEVRETHPLYVDRGFVHPGVLLRRANSALKDNVLLGPWMHVGSDIRNFRAVPVGSRLETRARVARVYDHKGHGFVDLDVALFVDGELAARIDHVSIYEPRQVRESA